MGSRFEFTAVHANAKQAEAAIYAAIDEVRRIEKLISSWDPLSQTSAVNAAAGVEPVVVDQELFQLVQRSLKVSELTEGAFDISFASIDRLWRFDGSMDAIPDSAAVAASVDKISYEDIVPHAEKSSLFLRYNGMKIGFGAIGKGYAANRAKKIMLEYGLEGGVVNAGGDLIAWGATAQGKDWRIGISDPNDKENVRAWLWMRDMAVVTSGDYEKYVELEGKRYAHIIDPRTGWPVQDMKSVTIVCPDAELADALATAVFVMGPEDGLELINQLKGIECVLITADNQMLESDGLKLNYYQENEERAKNEFRAGH